MFAPVSDLHKQDKCNSSILGLIPSFRCGTSMTLTLSWERIDLADQVNHTRKCLLGQESKCSQTSAQLEACESVFAHHKPAREKFLTPQLGGSKSNLEEEGRARRAAGSQGCVWRLDRLAQVCE